MNRSGGFVMAENENGKKPVPAATLEKLNKWFIETEKAEREALEKMPKKFKKGEGVSFPLPD
jgi:hypothetical protein